MNKQQKKGKEVNMVTNTASNVINLGLNSDVFRRAAELTDEIVAKQNELNALLSGQVMPNPTVAPVATAPTPADEGSQVIVTKRGVRRTLSPEARERIRLAQVKRWRKHRKQLRELEQVHSQQAAAAAPAPAPVQAAPAPAPAPVQVQVSPAPAPAPVPVAENPVPPTHTNHVGKHKKAASKAAPHKEDKKEEQKEVAPVQNPA